MRCSKNLTSTRCAAHIFSFSIWEAGSRFLPGKGHRKKNQELKASLDYDTVSKKKKLFFFS